MSNYFNEIHLVLSRWRIIHLLGIAALRARYSRSVLGQTWLTFANLIFIIAIGVVWSFIWKMPIIEYLPYVGIGHIIYSFTTTTVSESTTCIIADGRIYFNDEGSYFISVFAHVYKNIVIFLHNIPIIIGLLLWSGIQPSNLNFDYILNLFLIIVILIFLCHFISIISTRFRDLLVVIQIFFQILYLLTPVMWKIEMLPVQYQLLALFNPFALFLDAIRNPLLSMKINDLTFMLILVWFVISFSLSLLAHKLLSRKLIYWI